MGSTRRPIPLRKYKLLCRGTERTPRTIPAIRGVNDDAAIVSADDWRDNRGAELWRSYRVIKAWHPQNRGDSAAIT